MSEVYGATVESQTRLSFFDLGAFTANTTVSPTARFGVPVGHAGVRVTGLHVAGSAIPADPDGTMELNALVNDVSEAADDTIVSSQDLEGLVAAANQFYELTLATETSEKELTLHAGDTLRFTLVSDSAAIGTNPNVTVCVEWHPIPGYTDEDRIQHASDY